MSDLKFCPDCNNILYSYSDDQRLELNFVCRLCDYSRKADPNSFSDNCISRTAHNYHGKDNIFVSPLVVKDPTLGRTNHWKCARCGYNKAAFFQLPERVNDDAMMLVFVCCNPGCGYWAKQAYDDDVEGTNTYNTPGTTQYVSGKHGDEEMQTMDDMADLFGEDGI
ncbi:hypothetical protein BgAZ_207290 [Babesia gibsoni]|uniref:TFIIS-type domain-containing protein n=1 Tax=Babesia gibsoni TaxID=33632 RepID=A0AAD8PEH2_BABGI|nr:hypothetical protein BgAZ_207290 [Babesia gibsoni]